MFFFFKQQTAYGMRISDWSSDVCSSDLACRSGGGRGPAGCGRVRQAPSGAREGRRGDSLSGGAARRRLCQAHARRERQIAGPCRCRRIVPTARTAVIDSNPCATALCDQQVRLPEKKERKRGVEGKSG